VRDKPGVFFFQQTGIWRVELDDETEVESVLRQLTHDWLVVVQPALQHATKLTNYIHCKNIRKSTGILWRVLRILTEPV